MDELIELKNVVAGIGSVITAAIALIAGLHQRLEDALASDEPEENVQAIVDELDARKDELAAAIAANTIADPAPAGPITGAVIPEEPADPTAAGDPTAENSAATA